MKKFLLPILFILVGSSCAAQTRNTDDASNRSLLWHISGHGLKKTSYLFGTMHIICSNNYLWTKPMAAALDSSDAVCLEMDMDDPAVLAKAATAMLDNNGTTLASYFTKEQYERLTRFVKDSLAMDMTLLERMNLIGLETMMSVGAATCTDPVSYEDKIMETAHNSGKDVLGIEAPEEQIALLKKIPTDSLVKDILDIMNGKTENLEEYNSLISAYTTQNLPALYNIIKDDKDQMADLNEFLDERNEKWISRMTDKMTARSIFFAVGAGHLWGTNGVISLLQKAGYTVTPLH